MIVFGLMSVKEIKGLRFRRHRINDSVTFMKQALA